jgi:hypothetical protein
MKKIISILLILAVIGGVAAALVWKFYVNKPHKDIEHAKADYTLTTKQLWDGFVNNGKQADSLYNDKIVEISGMLSRTEKSDTLVYAVFVMEADSMFGDKSIRCEMLKKFNDETSQLTAGQEVKIKGYCTGYDDTDVKFNKCSIVK